MADYEFDLSQLPSLPGMQPADGTPPQDSATATTPPASGSAYDFDLSQLPQLPGMKPTAEPQSEDWWGSYWGPLKDSASRAYHHGEQMPATDPGTMQGLIQSRAPYVQDIAAGSSADADSDAKSLAANSAGKLAQIDHVLGVMGNGDQEFVGPSNPTDTLSQTPHARLMASDRYRQVYDSAVPVLGEDGAQDYARSTIVKQARDVPYLKDSILADIMGLPKQTAFQEQYGSQLDAAAPQFGDGQLTQQEWDQAGDAFGTKGEQVASDLRGAGLTAAQYLALAAHGAANFAPAGGSAVQAAAFPTIEALDQYEKEHQIEGGSKLQHAVTGFGAGLGTGIVGSDGGAIEDIRQGKSLGEAERDLGLSTMRNEAMLGAGYIGGPLAGRLAVQGATNVGLGAGERAIKGEDVLDPYAIGSDVAGAVIGAHGEAPGEAPKPHEQTLGRSIDADLGGEAIGNTPGIHKLRERAAAAIDAAGDDQAQHARIAYALDQVQSGAKNPMWAVAELGSSAKHGATRDETAFQQWHDQQAATEVEQTPAAETATPEAAATTEAAQALVGPSAAERDDRFRELAANPQRTPEEHEELANLAQQHVEQARVANSNEPIEGLQNENARQRLMADGDLGEHVMKLDLDDFKNTNDTHSMSTGNDAIKNAGERLAENAPEGVQVFHQSGDEFIAHSDDPAKLAQLRDATNAQLAKDKLLAQNKAGEVTGEIDHPVFSGGIGHDESSAEVALKAEKQRKLESGERLGRRQADLAPAVDESGRANGPEDAQIGGEEARVAGAADESAPSENGAPRAASDESESTGTGRPVRGQDGDVAPPATNPVDAAAHEAATSPLNEKPEPTPAQTSAGNYPKGHVRLQGMDISIENPKGSTRSGVDENGQPWTREMRHHYGYIKGTLGADGQHMDVMLGENPGNPMRPVFVINQRDANGGFDEHKVMLGFKNQRDAERAYRSEYPRGWDRMGDVRQMASPEFKQWLRTGAREEAHVGPVDAGVPRVTLRNQQTDAVAMHGVTNAPNAGHVDANGAPMPTLPNTNRNLRKRTYFDDARSGADSTHEAVLTNLYDLDKDPRGLVESARAELAKRGLPEDLPHLQTEFERQTVQHGYDGYRGGGKAVVLGDGVTTRERTNANDRAGVSDADTGRDEGAAENGRAGDDTSTAREAEPRAEEADDNASAAKDVNGGPRIGRTDEPPGTPAHPEPVGRTVKNADTEAARAKLGEPPAEPREVKPDEKLAADAKAVLSNNPDAGDQLAKSLIAKPRAASDTETAVLAMDRRRLDTERAGHLDRASAAIDAGDHEAAAVHAAAAEIALDKLRTNFEASTKAGTEWGRGGRARQLAPDEQYALARMLVERKVAKGAKLTPAEESETRALHETIADLQKQLAERQDRIGRRPVSKDARTQAKSDFDKAVDKFKSISKIEQMTKECAL